MTSSDPQDHPPRGERGRVPEDIEDADPGLARERTGLAWTRSSISFAAIGAAILKFRPEAGIPLLILSAAIWSLGRMPRTPGLAGAAPRRVLTVAISVGAVAVIALVLTFAGHSAGFRL
ncbi:MAG TPA: DUF202 domain-containing protein [Streptosporangiaceae bacterium]|nr:DUF202 domain-containing protein [Streptosporangiaceae bacterium]